MWRIGILALLFGGLAHAQKFDVDTSFKFKKGGNRVWYTHDQGVWLQKGKKEYIQLTKSNVRWGETSESFHTNWATYAPGFKLRYSAPAPVSFFLTDEGLFAVNSDGEVVELAPLSEIRFDANGDPEIAFAMTAWKEPYKMVAYNRRDGTSVARVFKEKDLHTVLTLEDGAGNVDGFWLSQTEDELQVSMPIDHESSEVHVLYLRDFELGAAAVEKYEDELYPEELLKADYYFPIDEADFPEDLTPRDREEIRRELYALARQTKEEFLRSKSSLWMSAPRVAKVKATLLNLPENSKLTRTLIQYKPVQSVRFMNAWIADMRRLQRLIRQRDLFLLVPQGRGGSKLVYFRKGGELDLEAAIAECEVIWHASP